MTYTLVVRLLDTTVRVEKNDVPQAFWLRVLAEWGTASDDLGSWVDVTLDRVIGRQDWLRTACKAYHVGIDWSDDLKQRLRTTIRLRDRLQRLLTDQPALGQSEVETRLAGTRFSRPLRPFQVRDLGKVLALDNAANFSVPGAGKTTVSLAAYEAERAVGRVDRLLVVAPLSAFEAWRDGVNDCFNGDKPSIAAVTETVPDTEIVLVNYHRLGNRYSELAQWVTAGKTMMLLDEAHRMKRGWDGQFGSACLNMSLLAARRDILTGTPAPQSPSDLVALLDFLWPGQARRVLPRAALVTPPPADAGNKVASAIRPLFVRTKKSELELRAPDKRVVWVEPSALQAQIYSALRDRYAGTTMSMSVVNRNRMARMGQIVMYLLEAATNPKLLSAGSGEEDQFRHPPLDIPPSSELWEVLRRYNEHETPAKFTRLAQLIYENAEAGRKTLVWTNFVRNMHTLRRMLCRYEPAAIYGGVPPEINANANDITREDELARFRDPDSGCMVLLANPAAMSEGVSLHNDTHDAIYLDRTFNAGHYLQSIDRIHRLGLAPDQDTRITFLLTKGTIDEVVDQRVREKAERLGEMLDDPDVATMALPSDEDYGEAVETQDLEALFRHLRGEG